MNAKAEHIAELTNISTLPEPLDERLIRQIVKDGGEGILERMRQNMSMPSDVVAVEKMMEKWQ